MNPTLASLPIDTNTLILIVVAIVSGLSGWLEKRRKAAASEKAPGEGKPPPPAPREASPAPVNMEELLRRMLGEEARPSEDAPEPVQTVGQPPREEPVVVTRAQPPEPVVKRGIMVPPSPQPSMKPPDFTSGRGTLPALGFEKWSEKPILRPGLASAAARSAAAAPSMNRIRRSPEAARAVALVRNPRAARTAFIASLVFGPPKSLENSQP